MSVEWTLVNTEGLATSLAEWKWKEENEVDGVDRLYDIVITEDGKMERVVNEEWASPFLTLRQAFLNLIDEFKFASWESDEDQSESQQT